MLTIYCDSSLTECCVCVGTDSWLYPYSDKVTVNQGEYLALSKAIEYAQRSHSTMVIIRSDSQLIVNQVLGIYKCKSPDLELLRSGVLSMLDSSKNFGQCIEIEWVPREQNLAGHVLEKRK